MFDESGFAEPTDEEVAALVKMEAALAPEMDASQLAERILQHAAPAAAQTISTLAARGQSETIRFRAATYIIDRTLGKNGDTPTEKAPWEELFNDVSELRNRAAGS